MSYSHLLPDGKTDTHLYLAPHFRRTADGWVPLRATLRTDGGAVQAPSGVRPLKFGSRAQNLLTIGTGAGPLRLSANNLSISSRRTEGTRVDYPDVAAQTRLSYQVLPYGADERIVLAGQRAPHLFSFTLHDPRHTLGRAIRQSNGGYGPVSRSV